jgi:hypothetical protein
MATTFEVVRAEALFASWLQASQRPAADEIRVAITTTLRRRGIRGCEAAVAEEFGDHPDTAAARMNWALTAVRTVYPAVSAPRMRRVAA